MEQRDSTVLLWIANLVSKAVTSSLVHLDDSSEACEDLEIRFGGCNGSAVFAIQEEIYRLKQGGQIVVNYYNELVRLWAEEDTISNHELSDLDARCNSTKCMFQKKEQDRVMKFLMSLNEVHYQVRSQTLARDPLSSVKEIYNIMRINEKQQDMQRNTHPETSALYAAPRSHNPYAQRYQNNSTNNGNQH